MFQADVYKIIITAPSDIKEEIDVAINKSLKLFEFRNSKSYLLTLTLAYQFLSRGWETSSKNN